MNSHPWITARSTERGGLNLFLPRRVSLYVKPFLCLILLTVSATAADPKLEPFLKGVENHYNKAKTLQVSFVNQYTPSGRIQHTETGTLLLKKPGRMRGDYSDPAGKIFISDNTYLYLYTPDEKLAQKMKLKDSFADDVRAPLAFLLGQLNFDKEFKDLQSRQEGANMRITGAPKGDTLPYSAVEFLITPTFHIQELKITLADHSVVGFTFTQEKMDPALDPKLFTFQLPPGAKWDTTVQ